LSVTPESFLAEARAVSARTDEMGMRLTINRAYYAAYHLALTVSHLCPNPPPAQAEGTHKALIRRFLSVPRKGFKGASIAREIGSWLDKGRLLRVRADYDLNATIHKGDPAIALLYTERIQGLIAQFAAQRAD
jgi:hypothetical protein